MADFSGVKMPTQINEPPTQPGIYPSVQPSQQPIPPWVQRDDDDLDLAQLLQILRRRSLIITGVAITVASVFWAWTLTRTPIYQGSFRVLIESVDENNASQELLGNGQGSLALTVDYDTQIEVLLSSVLLQPISQGLQEKYPNLTTDQIAEGLSINRLRETKVLEVSYRGSEPQQIQDILDEVAQQYLEYSFEQRQASLNQGIQFVDDQLPDLRERVNNLEVRLERFRQQYSLLNPENRGDDLSELISQVEEERQQLQTELSQARSLYRSLQGQLSVSPEEALAAAALSESPRYQALLNQIQELEAQVAVESAKYQPDSPQLASLRERRDNLMPVLEAEAADILGDRFAVGPGGRVDGNLTPTAIDLGRQLINAANNVQMLQARSQTLAQVEQSLKQEFALVPSLARQYTDLQRELEIATESLNRFLTTRETLQIDAAQKSIPWQLIAEPRTSRIPISPNIPRNLMLGILAGLLLGGTAALLIEKLDQVYHSPDELKHSTRLPLLGIIPFHPNLQERQETAHQDENAYQNGAAAHHDPAQQATPPPKASAGKRRTTFQSSMFYEAFRSLYTNIRFLGSDTPIRSLVISSAIPSEGKSTTALYLARAAAVMGQRVLLVDADLRSPKHHIRLGLPNIRGVSNLVSESLRVQDVVQRSPLDENLSVVTAGPIPPDPVKLLSSRRMQSLMEQFQQEYDFVVYDMPPIIGFADSNLVAAHTDGMIMVVGLGKTERSAIDRAIDEVKLSPVSILGLIANGIKSYTTRVYGYYRYYRYYPKHGSAQGAVAGSAMTPASTRSNITSPGDYPFSSSYSSVPSPPSTGDANLGARNPCDFRLDQSASEDDTASDVNTQYQAFYASPDHEAAEGEATSLRYPMDVTDNDNVDEPLGQAIPVQQESMDSPLGEDGLDEEYPVQDASLDDSPAESHQRARVRGSVQGWQYDATDSSQPAPRSSQSASSHFSAYRSTEGQPATAQSGGLNRSRSTPRQRTAPTSSTRRSWLSGRPRPTSKPEAPPSSPKISTATVHSDSLSAMAKTLMGLGIVAIFGALGWSLYQRFTGEPLPPPNSVIENPEPEAVEPDSDTPSLEALPDEEDDIPPVTDPGTTDTDPRLSPDQATNEATPELAPEVQDPFTEAVRIAQEAVAAGEAANTPEEWSRIAEQWQQASALMAIVPQTDDQFPVARDRTVLYRNNAEFARQKVLELLSNKDLRNAD